MDLFLFVSGGMEAVVSDLEQFGELLEELSPLDAALVIQDVGTNINTEVTTYITIELLKNHVVHGAAIIGAAMLPENVWYMWGRCSNSIREPH